MADKNDIETRSINTVRMLSADIVEKAGSGHPGMPIAAAPIIHVLWARIMDHCPSDPTWCNRDRFVLSAGHGSALIYSMLHLTGYGLSMDELQRFRQWKSLTAGHPEYGLTPGVEATTGPLGQGFSMGVGMAFAERMLAAQFNEEGFPLMDHYTYAICSDGDLMEGISSEAASLAGHQKLGKIIYLYDDNHITIEGETELAFSESVEDRFRSYGWQVLSCEDPHDLDELETAVKQAQDETEKPSLIRVRTHIAYGTSLQDDSSSHGAALGKDVIKEAKKFFGLPEDKEFYVPDEVKDYYASVSERGDTVKEEWEALLKDYENEYPEKAAEFTRRINGELPDRWKDSIPTFTEDDGPVATRKAGGAVLRSIADAVPEIAGGSADLGPSTKTELSSYDYQTPETPAGRNFHFGVREHAMAAAVNGMALHGGIIPFGATFFVFSDYCRPALRLSAIMDVNVKYVFTHDSIGVGEDGPTHQPVEQLSIMRVTPKTTLIRPADANETAKAWEIALERKETVMLALTRQSLPVLENGSIEEGVKKGGYVLKDTDGAPDVILIAAGSEVHPSLKAAKLLEEDDIKARVVSMPSHEIFSEQPQEYIDSVLPPEVSSRVAVEAGCPHCWYRWVGSQGRVIGIENEFGSSAPVDVVMGKYGFSAENVAETAREVLS